MKTVFNETNVSAIMSKCLKDAQRREHLGNMMNKHNLSCPECGTRQVQLIGYINTSPAQWKCRHCKHKFEWEKVE